MPTTVPWPSTSAPPELPGFSAASVWITSSIIRVVPPSRAGSERPKRRHHARGHRPGEAVRVADRDDELPDAQQSRVAQLRRGSDTRLRPQQRQVRQRIDAHDRSGHVDARSERHPHHPPARDHVRVREHEPVRRDHDARAGAATTHAQVRDRRAEPLGYAHHHLRVGVQRSHLHNDSDLGASTVPGGARPHASRRRPRSRSCASATSSSGSTSRTRRTRRSSSSARPSTCTRSRSRTRASSASDRSSTRTATTCCSSSTRPARPATGVAGRAAGGPRLPLGRIHGHGPARRVHDHRRPPAPARRDRHRRRGGARLPPARRAHRRVLPGDRGDRGAASTRSRARC